MTVERIFIGGGPGVLSRSAALIAERCMRGARDDAARTLHNGRGVLVITPTARGGRLLLTELAGVCGGALIPPEIVTPTGALDAMLAGKRPHAPLAIELLAWREGVVSAWDNPDTRQWFDRFERERDTETLAGLARRMHGDLASAGMTFARARELLTAKSGETRRIFDAAEAAAGACLRVLGEWGYAEPWSARLEAAEAGLFKTFGEIVLVGVLECPELLRRTLGTAPCDVTSIVLAGGELSDRFDEVGCAGAAWRDVRIDIDDACIAFVRDENAMVCESLAWLDGVIGAHPDSSSVVCCPDPRRAARFQAVAARHTDVQFRIGQGRARATSALAQHVSRVCDWFEHRSIGAARQYLSDAIGHSAASAWLASRDETARVPDLILAIDSYISQTMSERFTAPWLRAEGVDNRLLDLAILACQELLDTHVDPAIRAAHSRARPGVWAGGIGNAVWGALGAAPNVIESIAAEWVALRDVLGYLAGADKARALGAAEFAALVLDALAGTATPEEVAERSIEVVGWLELALEPSDCVVIAGLNDTAESASDGFTPREREVIGLPTRESRLARDAALLTSVMQRAREWRIVVPRRGQDGDPLMPSPLLFLCGAQDVARRLESAIGEGAPDRTPQLARHHAVSVSSEFAVMPRRARSTPTSIAATAFKKYLASPYLFYLEQIERLREPIARADEMEPNAFGTLIHEVLARFGRGAVRGSRDPEEVRDELTRLLEQAARARFGSGTPVSIELQLDAARLRLGAFAEVQAARARDGWEIVQVEWSPPGGGRELDVDGKPIKIVGKIDRIDRHTDGRYTLLDYKTSEESVEPRKAHVNRAGEWADLQLPLYRFLAADVIGSAPVDGGYVNLPGARYSAEFSLAGFTDIDHEDAMRAASDIVRAIREGRFDDLGRRTPRDGVFAALCGIGYVGLDTDGIETDWSDDE